MSQPKRVEDEWSTIGAWLRSVDNTELGRVFREYVEESQYGGFDGFTTHDVTGIRRMLTDLALYHNSVRDSGKG